MKSRMIFMALGLMCGSSLLCSSEIMEQKVWTDLHEAASSGDVKRVSELLDRGADRDAQSQNGLTPLDLAKNENHTEVIKLLQPLVANMLEDNTLSNGKRGWNDISILSKQKIGSLIMRNHPMVTFILRRVSMPFKNLEGHTGRVNSAAFNGAANKILTGSGDHTAKIWDVTTGDCLVTFTGHDEGVTTAVFNRAEDRILTASGDNTADNIAKIWDVLTGDCLVTLEGHTAGVYSAVFNGSEDKVLTASRDATAKIWDVHSGDCLVTFTGHTETVYSVVFNEAEDKVLTASFDRTAKIWNARTGVCITTFKGHIDCVYSAVFNGAEDRVLTASWSGTAKIWDAATGNCLVTLTGPTSDDDFNDFSDVNSAVFNGCEDKVLTSSDDGTARIWDAQTGTCLVTLTGPTSREVKSAVFNRSEDKVLIASWDGTAKIWDAQTGNCLVTLTGNDGPVDSAVFNGREDKVLTSADDCIIKIWDISIFNKLERFFSRDDRITLNQALILNCIYEIIVCRRLVSLKISDQIKKLFVNVPRELDLSTYVFDFNDYPYLQVDYEDLPRPIQDILDLYVKKTVQDDEASTSSTSKRAKTG